MSPDAIKRIEDWFAGGNEDGDFIRSDREDPYQIIGPMAGCDRIIYCTKSSVALSTVHENPSRFSAGLVAHSGLPCEEDASWLREFVGTRRVIFVGDLDPADVMIFGWLRQRLAPIEVMHHGINDAFMTALDVAMPEWSRIQLNSIEIAAVAELEELFPDVGAVLGTACLQLLKEGHKIELEAVKSVVAGAAPISLGAHDYEW